VRANSVIASSTPAGADPLDETLPVPLSRRKPGPTSPTARVAEKWTPAFAGEACDIGGHRGPSCFLLDPESLPGPEIASLRSQ
jgi:hypothetical protein